MQDPFVGPRSRGKHEAIKTHEHKHYVLVWIGKFVAVVLIMVVEFAIIIAVIALLANSIIKALLPGK